jgi:hypothetical protein
MKRSKPAFVVWPLAWMLIIAGCGLIEEPKPKNTALGLVTTPTAYYSTPKARYLGQRYKQNLDTLVERIVRNPKTANLQFANNIASVGGIGFFTHSAATVPDERYLEVVLAAPETFEVNGEYSAKVSRLFTLYGMELLSLLASDSAIYQESEVSGYGLNLSWRKVVRESGGPRVALERAIAYFPKQRVRAFLRQDISQNELLKEAVIFAVEEDGPMNLVSYRPAEPKPDFSPPIQEETLSNLKMEPKSEATRLLMQPTPGENVQVPNVEKRAEASRKPTLALNEKPASFILEAPPIKNSEESNSAAFVPEKTSLPVVAAKPTAEKAKPKIAAEKKSSGLTSATDKSKDSSSQSAKASVTRLEVSPPASAPVVKRAEEAPPMPAVDTPREVKVSELTQSRNEPSTERSTELIANPRSPENQPLIADVPRRPTDVSPSAKAPPVNESVKEINAQEELANSAKTPDLSVPVSAAMESKSEPVVVASKPVAKAPPVAEPAPKKISDAKAENVSESSSNNAAVTKAETTKAPDQPKAVAQSKPEPATVAPKPVKASAIGEPAIAETVKTPEQARPVEQRKPQPVIAALKPEIKAPTVVQPGPTDAARGKEENAIETTSRNAIVGKAETAKAPDRLRPVEQTKLEPVIVAPNPAARAPVAAEPAPAKVTQAKEENVTATESRSATIAKAETVKLGDQPKRVEEKKTELGFTGPKLDVKADAKSQPEIVVREKTAEPAMRPWPVEERRSETAVSELKQDVKAVESVPAPTQGGRKQPAKDSEQLAGEQIALLTKKPSESALGNKPAARPVPRALEGYIIQLSFSAKGEAQRWAENLTERGYAVSMTEAGGNSAFRVRIGNFSARSEAERQLKTLAQNGLKGIVLNLPQAYRPEIRSLAPDTAEPPISITP